MTKIGIRVLLGLVGVASIAVLASSALAGGPPKATCTGGSIAGGTYKSLTITGNCTWAGQPVTVDGNLTVADGAVLNDHDATTASVTVNGNVKVGKGAVLGLGSYNPYSGQTTVVNGNVEADQPLSLYLSFMTIHGNLHSNGGGGGVTGEFRNFPTKDDTVDGNVEIQGWTGGWIGLIRTHVGGNVIFSKNQSVLTADDQGNVTVGTDPDSSEVVTNVIGGNLICQGNSPAVQLGDSGGSPNVVGGHKIGQCTAV